MIIRSNENKHEIRTEMRGGTGEVHINHLVGDKPANCRLFSTLTLATGSSIGEHIHEHETEIFYVLQGTAQYCDNGDWGVIEKGDIAVCAPGQTHSVKNDNDADLVLLAVIITE